MLCIPIESVDSCHSPCPLLVTQETTETAQLRCGAHTHTTSWPLRKPLNQFTTSSGTRLQPMNLLRLATTELSSSGCLTRRRLMSPWMSTRRTCQTTCCRNITWYVSMAAIGLFEFNISWGQLKCKNTEVYCHNCWLVMITRSMQSIKISCTALSVHVLL